MSGWEPLPTGDWDRAAAAHLLRRAAFGGTPDDLEAAAAGGLGDTLAWLFAGEPEGDPIDAGMRALGQGETYDARNAARGAWAYRLIHAASPLRERMTLFWHSHFATGLQKVGQVAWMRQQIQTLRETCFGPFDRQLLRIAKDPAMLRWLDNTQNKKDAPNENFARELFELFSLGIGNYTETDIKEAARAFTGWHLKEGEFFFNSYQHDDGVKRVLGKRGRLGGEDVIRRVLELPACATFLASKLFSHFAWEDPEPALVEPLARRIRDDDYRFDGALRMLFRSKLFYSERARLRQIKSPVEYVVGMIQALGAKVPPAEAANAMSQMGQRLYEPPSVKGWDGGRAWISSAALFQRQSFARRLVRVAHSPRFGWALDLLGPPQRAGATEPEARVRFWLERLLPGAHDAATVSRLTRFFSREQKGSLARRSAELVHLICSLPDYQLA